jgi:branched-chain amino acid aminotransferase
MPKLVWLNGEIMPLESAVVSAADHAHLYGDGLFEGIRIYNGKIFKLNEHLERLYHGINYLGFDMRMSLKDLRQTVLDVCKQAQIMDGYIRLNVTRGTGLGLDPKNIKPANTMIMINTLALYPPEAYEMGLKVVTSAMRVIPADSLDPRVKAIGRYVSNIFAKQEGNRQGAGEALMLNQQGQVAECTGDNIFVIQNGIIRTPHPSCGILAGITRQTLIDLAREKGYTVEETILTPFDVYAADEVFLTGTAAEVIPMITLDNRQIGCGKPGQITQELMAAYHEAVKTGTAF